MKTESAATPSIDVIIPVYNGGRFVGDAINSVVEQIYPANRIIVVNDGSTDNTEAAVLEIREKSKIEIVYVKKDNGGPNSARNSGLELAKSGFVAFLDADDCWYPNKLERQIAKFGEGDGRLGVVYCGYSLIDGDGKPFFGIPIIEIDETMRGQVFRKLLRKNMIIGSASGVLVRRSCFETVGRFDESLRVGEDWDMWLRLAKEFKYDFVNEPLIKIRRHSDNAQADDLHVFRNLIRFYDKWASLVPASGDVPVGWAKTLSVAVLGRFPAGDFLTILIGGLSGKSRRRMFRLTFGSVRLFLSFAAAYLSLRGVLSGLSISVKSVSRFFGDIGLICFGKYAKRQD
ncbi:glycosyltransferase [Candidatus Uhrbacteria bacterium]|nr:glycosyltransferase [Candidatus Uhrbacteria bacterium]